MDWTIDVNWLDYVDRLVTREAAAVELVVIHCTELPDLTMAREYAERVHYPESGTGNSGHFYIDRDGSVHQWVPVERVAHHVRGYNASSIGIELVNRGRYPRWHDSDHQAMTEPYSKAQVTSLKRLLPHLTQTLPGLVHIAGHEDLDSEKIPAGDRPDAMVRRKVDPGPLLPWDEVLTGVRLRRLSARRSP